MQENSAAIAENLVAKELTMSDLQEYKCPCCGGAIEFNSSLQKLKCPYCDTEFELDALKQYEEDVSGDQNDNMQWDSSATPEWTEDEENGMRLYVCKSCGGEIIADENTAASLCPFCDNPVVMKGSIKGALKPELIIPFKLDKKAAMAGFAQHLKKKALLPKVFKEENHIQEIKGIYVPYWLFDTKADAHMRYKGTRVRCWSDSKYNYTETSYFAITRDGKLTFEHVPADGSSKMPDDLMESIEPFDFKDAVPFESAYFAGYYADKYDVDDKQSIVRVNERVRNATAENFMNTIHGYSSVIPDGGSINLSENKTCYAMYPVWILHTKWRDQLYTFAMNGQTGKFVGNLPIDKNLRFKYFGLAGGIAFVGMYLILSLIWLI